MMAFHVQRLHHADAARGGSGVMSHVVGQRCLPRADAGWMPDRRRPDAQR